jgi:hypothetical protein
VPSFRAAGATSRTGTEISSIIPESFRLHKYRLIGFKYLSKNKFVERNSSARAE